MEDAEDEGLKAVMGDKFQDVREGKQRVGEKAIPQSRCSRDSSLCTMEPLSEQKPEDVMNAGWVKLNVVSPMAKVKACAKWATVFGSVSGLLFYWQQAGLLDERAAIPSLIFCALGAGLTVGWHAK